MKNLLSIFFVFFCGCTKSQQHFYHLIKGGVTSHVTSQLKNIRPIIDLAAYEFAGVPVQNGPNQVTYYYRRGTSHTAGGNPYYRTLNIVAGTWSDPVLIASNDSLDSRDVSGGKMDNDSVVIFYQRGHTDVYHTKDIYIQKCDLNNNFTEPVLFDWTGITHLQGGMLWGPLVTGDNAGEYYQILYQQNVDTGSTTYRVSLIKTTDYWNTYSEAGVLYDDTSPYSETACSNLGGGKFLAVARLNIAGTLTPFESTNYGATWVRRPSSNLFWYNTGSDAQVPYIYSHDGVFDIPFTCRDADMIEISKGNTIAENFGTSTYKDHEIYGYNAGGGTGNTSLGYVSELKLTNGKFLLIYSKQYSNGRANLQWTYDDLVTDPGGLPDTPVIATSFITSSSFKAEMTDYTDKQVENIRWFEQDLSTSPDFSDFVTAEYRIHSGSYPAVEIHNIKVTGLWDSYHTLTTGTTYSLRIKACNNVGCSNYSTINVTTL